MIWTSKNKGLGPTWLICISKIKGFDKLETLPGDLRKQKYWFEINAAHSHKQNYLVLTNLKACRSICASKNSSVDKFDGLHGELDKQKQRFWTYLTHLHKQNWWIWQTWRRGGWFAQAQKKVLTKLTTCMVIWISKNKGFGPTWLICICKSNGFDKLSGLLVICVSENNNLELIACHRSCQPNSPAGCPGQIRAERLPEGSVDTGRYSIWPNGPLRNLGKPMKNAKNYGNLRKSARMNEIKENPWIFMETNRYASKSSKINELGSMVLICASKTTGLSQIGRPGCCFA